MASFGYLVIIGVFVLYYLLVLIFERKILSDPREILEKFLSVALLYAGISLVYFSVTGNPLFGESMIEYYVYIFLIGFIAILWAIPNLLSEFWFFRKFQKSRESLEKSRKSMKKFKRSKL